MTWEIRRERGRAADLHRRSAEMASAPGARRTACLMEAVAPALVLGSAQPESHVDAAATRAAGVDVVRRRSGGGAVLVGTASVVWVDLLVPAGDPLWQPDVGKAAWWVGDSWARALAGVGIEGATVWKAGMRRSAWSDRVCFAGTGPGEVLIGAAKAVGVSQRRTRTAALFQTAAAVTWAPAELLGFLSLAADERRRAFSDLAGAVVGVGAVAGARLFDAVVDSLPS